MAQVWEADYKGHTIKVENSRKGERLTVDGELQDHTHEAMSSRLWGTIRSGEGQGEKVKVHVGGKVGQKCTIFVNDTLVFSSHK